MTLIINMYALSSVGVIYWGWGERMRAQFHQALGKICGNIQVLGAQATQAASSAMHALSTLDMYEAKAVKQNDRSSDQLRYEVENACLVLIATQQPVARDLQILLTAMFVAVELERCGDYAKGIAKAARRIIRTGTGVNTYNLMEMETSACDMLARAVDAFILFDLPTSQAVIRDDAHVDQLYLNLRRQVISDMTACTTPVEDGAWLLHAGHCLERFADRAADIAARVEMIAEREDALNLSAWYWGK